MKNLINEAFIFTMYRNIELLTASDNDYDFHVIVFSSSRVTTLLRVEDSLWRDIEILYFIFLQLQTRKLFSIYLHVSIIFMEKLLLI